MDELLDGRGIGYYLQEIFSIELLLHFRMFLCYLGDPMWYLAKLYAPIETNNFRNCLRAESNKIFVVNFFSVVIYLQRVVYSFSRSV